MMRFLIIVYIYFLDCPKRISYTVIKVKVIKIVYIVTLKTLLY